MFMREGHHDRLRRGTVDQFTQVRIALQAINYRQKINIIAHETDAPRIKTMPNVYGVTVPNVHGRTSASAF